MTDKLFALHRMGVGHVMTLQNFGLMPQPLAQASMTRLMRDVLPRLRERVARDKSLA